MGFDLERLDDSNHAEPDYDSAQSIAELTDIVSMASHRKRGADWAEAIEVADAALKGERDPLLNHPFLAGIAAARGRTGDPGLRAAIRRIEQGRKQ